jgi:hypothetical protein
MPGTPSMILEWMKEALHPLGQDLQRFRML